MKSVHEESKYICDQCDFKSGSKTVLQKHKESVHEENRHRCDKCDYRATAKDEIKRHKEAVHGIENKESSAKTQKLS